MTLVIDEATFTKGREHAKFHKRDDAALICRAELSVKDRAKLRFGPVCVGEVDFGQWEEGDSRQGTPRRLPLYLFEHDNHVSVDHPHGFPDSNERLICHCGHKHYFTSLRYREFRALVHLAWHVMRNGRPQKKIRLI